MATESEKIAASQQRQMIPQRLRLVLEDWADATLESVADDVNIPLMDRAYARYELAYRKAFGLRYVLHPETGAVVVFDMSNKSAAARKLDEIEAAEARVKERAKGIRARKS